METLHGVALFAAIVVRWPGELAIMRVFVAVGAADKLHVVNRVFPRRDVALLAGHSGMHSLERIT